MRLRPIMRALVASASEQAGQTADSRPSHAAAWWLIWVLWLPFFIPPAADYVRSRPPLGALIASLFGAAVFFALYLWMTWRCACRLASPAPTAVPSGMARWGPVLALVALAVGLTLANGPEWGALCIFSSAAVAGWLPTREAIAVIVALLLFTVLGLGLQQGFGATISPAAFIAVPGLCVLFLTRSVADSQRLRAAREEMAALAASADERLRIARDLHDLLGHSLSLIALKSELARRLAEVAPARAADEIADIEEVARTALREVREAVSGYRQPTLQLEIASARATLEDAGVTCRVTGEDIARAGLPPAVDAALAWALREGVTNIVRHSHARTCAIRLAREANAVTLDIVNDGVNQGALADAGNGLRGLAERLALVGGACEAGVEGQTQFRLVARAPIHDAAPAPDVAGIPAKLEGMA